MKILQFLLKYFTIFLLFGLILYLTKFYGNSCGDLYVYAVAIPFFGIAVLLNIAILYYHDFKKKKYKTTNQVLLFLFSIFTINILFGYLLSKREPSYILEPNVEYNNLKIKLFKNNRYELYKQYNHGGCTYVGNYIFENDTLNFQDSKIEKQSENVITEKYKYNTSKKKFEPLKNNYKILKIVYE